VRLFIELHLTILQDDRKFVSVCQNRPYWRRKELFLVSLSTIPDDREPVH
jgi:hypothetical protein